MFFELIAAFAAGFAGAGIALIGRNLSSGRLPRASIPIFAATGMFGIAIWNEYSWFSRTSDSLPDGIVVVQTHAQPSAFRPWTYLSPYVSRFMAVDRASIRRNEAVPEQRIGELLLFAHHQPPVKLPLLVDCQAGRRADIADGMTFDQSGAVTNADWRDMPAEDPLLTEMCS